MFRDKLTKHWWTVWRYGSQNSRFLLSEWGFLSTSMPLHSNSLLDSRLVFFFFNCWHFYRCLPSTPPLPIFTQPPTTPPWPVPQTVVCVQGLWIQNVLWLISFPSLIQLSPFFPFSLMSVSVLHVFVLLVLFYTSVYFVILFIRFQISYLSFSVLFYLA